MPQYDTFHSSVGYIPLLIPALLFINTVPSIPQSSPF
jgi:hypothetical protein